MMKSNNHKKENRSFLKIIGTFGSCWAFAAYAALESSLLPGKVWDFSEQHLIMNHGFKYNPCEGGNIDMAVAYLARWKGPVSDSDYPYQYAADIHAQKEKKHIQDVIYISKRKNSKDNKGIKNAVLKYGAVHTSMYYDGSKYNPSHFAYHNQNSEEGAHCVAIVG